mmetsp:Transcript_6288/g.22097  ORF Transcript_6288/g.22097 Transcript_6288/m.22097 type:complete len:431 (+) Transcript_6288:389-1681(+)|eukprot:CAMPEP_0183794292 /NCGR_PEP_ID=MMETSP0803_2-20130417/3749_1 /TAXON_ID=195967 /ORGANISM="Crustomastix stigmata, Strain CCMP3273" /LENGTH=430 /DNA_ID=CAMNT_0026038693 /DNA_START=355 /DNA_END=1647 /DNA_ORIENTATION=-
MNSDETGHRIAPRVALRLSDFDTVGTLGDGSYSQVLHVRQKTTGHEFALKVMNKRFVMKERKQQYVKNERNILDRLRCEKVVQLCFTFQDEHFLYMGMELCTGGELFSQLRRVGKFSMEAAVFYTAEITLILSYLHEQSVIHRDLKPENLLLTHEQHLKLCDFGSAKDMRCSTSSTASSSTQVTRANSFVGTADYVSPEVLESKEPITFAADFWALGCILYQMLVGCPPFRAETEYLTFQKVLHLDYQFPSEYPSELRDLTEGLLKHNARTRMNASDIFAHRTYEGLNWNSLSDTPPPPLQVCREVIVDRDSEAPLDKMKGLSDASLLEGFLDEGEAVLYTSLVKKTRGFFSKRRQLILTSKPRLFYIETPRLVVKGHISLGSLIGVTATGEDHFTVHVPGRDYIFIALCSDALHWADMIQKVQSQLKDK